MPMPNLRVRISRQVSTKELRRASTASLISKRTEARPVGKPCGVMKAKPGRRKKHAARSTHDDPPPPAAGTPISQPVSEMDEFDPAVVSSPDEFSSFAQAMDDTSDTHCGTLVFETSPVHHSLPRAGLDLRGDAAGLGLSPDPLSPNFCTLSATERSALYPLLSGAFSSRDTQECAGTYRTYMQERSRLYYEELLAVPCEKSRNDRRPASSGDHQSVPEFRRWVNPGESCASQARNKPVKGGASTIRQKTSPVLPYGTDNEAYPLETLFPMLNQNRTSIDDLWESPVVRTQHQSYVPLDFSFLPNAESGDAEDHLATSLGPPGFPECSVLLPSKIHGESVHGHPDFPRSPPLLPPAELQQVDVNPKRFTPPLQQPISSPNVHEMGACTLKQKSSRTQTRFAPCTPPKREYDRTMMRSITSRSARRRTTSACGGI